MEQTIHGLIRKRAEMAGQHQVTQKAADAIKADLDAIDSALVLCGCDDDLKAIAPRGKYKQMFGRGELKRIILQTLREAPADDEAVVARVIEAKGWDVDAELRADILKRTHDAIQRAQKTRLIMQDFGPEECRWKLSP